MKGQSSLFRSALRLRGQLRRLARQAVGRPVTACTVALLAALLGQSFLVAHADSTLGMFPLRLLITVLELLAALGCALLGGGVFVALAYGVRVSACRSWRRFWVGLTEILADIPALAGVGLLLFVHCTPFLAICLASGLSLGVRSSLEVLKVGSALPPAYAQTVRSLRLPPGMVLRHLRLPLNFPLVARSLLRDLPDFWVRLFGSQMLVAIFLAPSAPSAGVAASGLGGQVVQSFSGGHVAAFVVALLGAVCLALLFQQWVARPLWQQAKHYETGLSKGRGPNVAELDWEASETERQTRSTEHKPGLWRLNWRVLHRAGFLLPVGALALGAGLCAYLHLLETVFRPALWFALVVAAVLAGVGVQWLALGIWALRWPLAIYKTVRNGCVFLMLFPVFFLYRPLSLLSPDLFSFPVLLWVSVQGLAGFIVLRGRHNQSRNAYLAQACRLRLSRLMAWRTVGVPLTLPCIGVAQQAFSWSAWNPALLAVAFLPVAPDFLKALQLSLLSGHMPTQVAVLVVVTGLVFVYRKWGVLPLRDWIARKYEEVP